MAAEPGKITYSDIYKGLWKCRDFELEHYWQRAVFLTAFLLACYAGYGTLIIQCATTDKLSLPFCTINGMAFCICLVGILLSLLWLMMSKGSKAWYEHYESAINAFVERCKTEFEGDAASVAGFKIADVEEFRRCRISSWLWNAYGGAYSVSRINVAIGHLSILIWTGLLFAHIAIAGSDVNSFSDLKLFMNVFTCPKLLIGCAILVLLSVWIYVRIVLKSSYLEDT